ncbi:MAG: ATP-binding protein [Thermodesulfovibrionales bacterium]
MRTWQRLSIRYKIVFIIFAVIILITVTTLPVVANLIKDALTRQQQAHLKSVRNLVAKLLDDYESKVTNYTKLFSNDKEIKDTLFYYSELSGERVHPLRAVSRLFHSFDISSIELCDSEGRVVATAEEPERFDNDRTKDPLIHNALQGKTGSGIELTERGFMIKATAPIYYNDNQLIGTITSGILIDESLLQKIKGLSDTEIVITDKKGEVVASTYHALRPTDRGPGVIGRAIQDLNDILFAGNRDDFQLIKLSLKGISEDVIGDMYILKENYLPQLIAKAYLALFPLFFLITSISSVIVFMVLKRLTSPIIKLREGAERIGKGDFRYRMEVKSGDELGELAEGFNRMAENLERLQEIEERLNHSERLASIGRFAAAIAHEINNPVGNIIGLAKLMKRDINDEGLRADLETIISDADRCGRIIKDLLIYSRQSPPKKERVSLGDLIKETVNSARKMLDSKRIEIVYDMEDALPYINADPLQIGQVLHNIIQNSIQSIESEGLITVRAMRSGNEWVEISVKDTGCGIDEGIKDKIFYPFFTTKKVGEGTGLGLAISYSIIQNHGGEISVESKKGEGSEFVIRLPLD